MAYPDSFFTNHKISYLLSAQQKEQLFRIYEQIKDTSAYKRKQLTLQKMVICLNNNPSTLFILSLRNSKSLTLAPAKLLSLREQLINAPSKALKWQQVRQILIEAENMSQNEHRQRRQLILDNLTLLLDITAYYLEHSIINEESNILTAKMATYLQADIHALKEAATQHFNQVFSQSKMKIDSLDFTSKLTGAQLGAILELNYTNSQGKGCQIKYFIKTDQFGSTSQASRAQAIDPKELLVYKTLELTGYGPKVHFIVSGGYNKQFYIATQDVGFSKQDDKRKKFMPYSELREAFEQKDAAAISLEAQKAFSRLDLLSRILTLNDLITNKDNYGRVSYIDHSEKWKIIDFRVIATTSYKVDRLFDGFTSGNGMLHYTGKIDYLLRKRSLNERLTVAKSVMREMKNGLPSRNKKAMLKTPLIPAIQIAYNIILTFIDNNTELWPGIELGKLKSDLLRYVQAAKYNYDQFATALDLWHGPKETLL